jgi:hypothetical protein
MVSSPLRLKSAFLDVALNQSANAVDLSITQKENGENPGNPGGENPGNPGGENPGNPGGENPAIRVRATPVAANRASSRLWHKRATSGIPQAHSRPSHKGPSLALYNSLLMLSAPEARDAFNQLSARLTFRSVHAYCGQHSVV